MSLTTFRVISFFLCSAQEDWDLCQELDKHLSPLKIQGWITCWSDQQILAGMEREREMTWHRQNADIFLLLISPDFLASEDCQRTMENALQRAADGSAVVISVLLRPVAWKKPEFSALQILPTNHLPVTSWVNRDEAFEQITEQIRAFVETLRRWVVVVSSPHYQSVLTQLLSDLEAHRIPARELDFSLDQADLQAAIRLSSAVLLLTSAEMCFSSPVRQTVEWAAIYQRETFVLWAGGEEQNESMPEQLHGSSCIDARPAYYEVAIEEVLARLKHCLSVSLPNTKADRDHQPRNPYKGLRSFDSTDARDFFGREGLIEELLMTLKQTLMADKLGQRQGRLLAVIGASGSGKSSVVMAGLLPRLRAGALPGSEAWVYLASMTPGEDPIESLANALSEHYPKMHLGMICEDLEENSARGLHQYMTLLARRKEGSGMHIVLIVDQFEELFSQPAQEERCQHFLDLLITAMTVQDGPLIVILTLRADFYDRVMHYPDLYHLIDAHHCSVLPMDIRELRQVIEQPAALSDVQLQFEGELVSDLLLEIRGERGILPLLQFTLDQLFNKRNDHLLTQQAYQEMGGVKGALSQHAEQAYTDLTTEEHRKQAQAIFLRLIVPGVSEQDVIRRHAKYSEFTTSDPKQSRLLQEIVNTFIVRRLLTASEVAGTSMIEVSHEALLWEWPRLVGWVREARDDMRFQQTLSEDAAEWEQRKRSADRLYRGTQLKEARSWSKRNAPSANEQTFLRASAAQQVQSVVSFVIIMLLFVSSVSAAGWYALRQAPDPTRVTNRNDDGQGSLRWCIASAHDGSTITFDQSVRGTILLTNGDLMMNKKLIIRGPGADILAISSGHTNFKIHIFPKASVTISDLSFKDSTLTTNGFITNEGTLRLINSTLSGNSSGAVRTFEGITSFDGAGGGIYNLGMAFLINSTVSSNFAGSDGGGIFNSGKVFLTNSTLSNNYAGLIGGGISNDSGGTVFLTNATLSDNSAGYDDLGNGGGVANSGTVSLTNSTLSNNFTTGRGGGIVNFENGTVSLTDSILSVNHATDGGGMANDPGGTVSLINATLFSNQASKQGGGISNLGTISLTNSTFSGNSTNSGPGGGISNLGTISLTNSTLFGNSSIGGGGGGIYNSGGRVNITFCTIAGNTASQGGGILLGDYKDDSTGNTHKSDAIMKNSIAVSNRADIGSDISGPLISGGYNLIQNNIGAMFTPNIGDQFVSDLFYVFPGGLQLQKNDGLTQTLALLPDLRNPAFTAIPLSFCQTKEIFDNHSRRYIDQRDMKRPGGKKKACDIGAYEYQS